MSRKRWACSGGDGPNGLSYFSMKDSAKKAAKERGVKLRRYNANTGMYDPVK